VRNANDADQWTITVTKVLTIKKGPKPLSMSDQRVELLAIDGGTRPAIIDNSIGGYAFTGMQYVGYGIAGVSVAGKPLRTA
jgi:hypothetical protein